MKKSNDCIHVEGVWTSPMCNCTHCVHVRTVPVLLEICTMPVLICVHAVSVKYDDNTYTASVTTSRYATIPDLLIYMLCLFC